MPRYAATTPRLPSRFAADRRGTTAILFAMMALPLIGVITAGVDYGLALRTHGTLQRAADAAASAALAELPMGRDAVAKALRKHFDVNVPERFQGLDLPFTMSDDPPRVTVAVETEISTTMLAMMGYPKMAVRVEGLAVLDTRARQLDVPKGFEDTQRELARQGVTIPPEAAREAERALRDLGIDVSAAQGHKVDRRELEEMAERAMRELERANLGDLMR